MHTHIHTWRDTCMEVEGYERIREELGKEKEWD